MSLPKECDCLVIGGGPAGTTAAALVAEAGHNVVLLERETFPRFHVGESLMPETYWLFERLGILDSLKKTNAPRKVGVQFVSGDGRESAPFFFKSHDERDCSTTWHVVRSEFDEMLMKNAEKKGANCFTGVRVMDVMTEGDRVVGVVAKTKEGERQEIKAKVVIDASGQGTIIASKFGYRKVNPNLKKTAIWGYFKGARRDEAEGGVRTFIMKTRSQKSWFWYIPISNDTVSIGLVGNRDYLLKGRGDAEQVFQEELADCPGVKERIAGAKLTDKYHVAKEFSYTTERSAGDGWVLVGDAWGFIDPVYSSGIHFAMKSADLAATCVKDALDANDPSEARLGSWLPAFGEGIAHVRKLVDAFYNPDFRIGQFIKTFPEHRGNLVDLLIGRIFDPETGNIFNDLDPWIEKLKEQTSEM